jgi:hypothetical protein
VIDERAQQYTEQQEGNAPAQIAPDRKAQALAVPVPYPDQRKGDKCT